MKKKFVPKNKRRFIEDLRYSNSWYSINYGQWTSLTLDDCSRTIEWGFGAPGDRRSKQKIKVIKEMVDELYNYLHEIEDDD